jgi:hypothetical protein
VALLTFAVAESVAAQTMTTVAGNGRRGSSPDGTMAAESSLDISDSRNVAPDLSGNLCFAEDGALRVRCIERTTGRLVTIAGGGGREPVAGAHATALFVPKEIAFDSSGNLFVAGGGYLRSVDRKTGVVTTIHGGILAPTAPGRSPQAGLRIDPSGIAFDRSNKIVVTTSSATYRLDFSTGIFSRLDEFPQEALSPRYDRSGNLYLALSCDAVVRRIEERTGLTTRVAGTGQYDRSSCEGGYRGDGGPAIDAELRLPTSLAVDGAGNVFICDSGNHAIRRVDAKTGVITTVAGGTHGAGFSGDGGPASKAALSWPTGLGLDGLGNLYIVDKGNARIRKVENIAAR